MVHVGHTRSITKQATVVIVADYLQWNYFGVTKGLKQPSIKAALSDSTRKKANVTVIRCVWETEGANLGQTGACTRITRVMNVHVSVRPGPATKRAERKGREGIHPRWSSFAGQA